MTVTLKWWGLLVAVAIGAVLGAVLMHNFAPSDQHQQIAAQQDTIRVTQKQLVVLRKDSAGIHAKATADSEAYEVALTGRLEPSVVAPVKPIARGKAPPVISPVVHDTSYVPLPVVPQRVIQACGEYIKSLQAELDNCEERAQSYQRLFTASQKELALVKQRDKDWHLSILAQAHYDPADKAIDPLAGLGLSKGFVDFMVFYNTHYRSVEPAIGLHLRLF